jgi:IS30 family transposase
MTPISLRPPEVAARIVPGHWEGDLIKGAGGRSAIGTLVERTSRYVMLVRLDGCSAQHILEGFSRRLLRIPPDLRRTLTYDQGSEMALHKVLARRLHMDVFFCDAYKPWQRGSNENANGIIRRPDQQDDSAYRVAGSPSEPPDCEHVASKQEVGHGAEQGSVPEGAVDAGVLRSIRLGAAV